MIFNSLSGTLSEKAANSVCIDIHGVEWALETSSQSIRQLPDTGEPVRLYTYLRVSENYINLYGFISHRERMIFQSLITVPGIGSRVALGILSNMDCEQLIESVAEKDERALSSLPGLGKKTAQKVILQLSDQFKAFLPVRENASRAEGCFAPLDPAANRELVQSLTAMGYPSQAVEQAVEKLNGEWLTQGLPATEGERLHQAIILLKVY